MTGLCCRASAEATVTPEAPAARRTTRDKLLVGAATSADNAALPPRQTLAPSQQGVKARAALGPPVAVVQPAPVHPARRSPLSRHAPQDGIQQQQQQQQPVATPSGGGMGQQIANLRLAAIPEAAEAPAAEGAPQDVQQEIAGTDTAAGQGSAAPPTAAPAAAVPAPALTGPDAGAATQQHRTAEQLETPHLPAGPAAMSSPDGQSRSLGAHPSSRKYQHGEPYLAHPAMAAAAVRESMTQAAAPLSLMQLAAGPTAQQPSEGLASSGGHPAPQPSRHLHRPAAQQVTPPPVSDAVVETGAQQDVSTIGADILQSLQASMVQTVTAAVESAMTQVRWVVETSLPALPVKAVHVTCMTLQLLANNSLEFHHFQHRVGSNLGSACNLLLL